MLTYKLPVYATHTVANRLIGAMPPTRWSLSAVGSVNITAHYAPRFGGSVG